MLIFQVLVGIILYVLKSTSDKKATYKNRKNDKLKKAKVIFV